MFSYVSTCQKTEFEGDRSCIYALYIRKSKKGTLLLSLVLKSMKKLTFEKWYRKKLHHRKKNQEKFGKIQHKACNP